MCSSQVSRVFCANLTLVPLILWDLYQSQKASLILPPHWAFPDVQESEAQLDTYMKHKTFRHYVRNIFQRGPNACASDCACGEVVVWWCDKKHLSWQADYSQFISKGACKESLGRIWCPLGQGCSCAGPLVQASRASSVWFEEVQDPAPHELCFARLSLKESEICPLLAELPFVLHGKSFPGSGWCNCGAKLSLFIWGRLRP